MAAITLADLMNPLTKIEALSQESVNAIKNLTGSIREKLTETIEFHTQLLEINKSQLTQLEHINSNTGKSLFGRAVELVNIYQQIQDRKAVKGWRKEQLRLLSDISNKLGSGGYAQKDQNDQKSKGSGNKIKEGTDTLLHLGKSVLKFAFLIALAAPLLIVGTAAAAAFVLVAGSLSLAMVALSKFDKSIKEGSSVLNKMGVDLTFFAIGVALLYLDMETLFSPQVLEASIFTIIGLGTATALIGTLSRPIRKGAMSLGILGIGLLSFSISYAIFAKGIKYSDVDKDDILIQSGIILAMGAAAALVGLLASKVILGSIGIGLIGVGLLSFSLGYGMFAKATSDIDLPTIGIQSLILTGVVGAMALAGFAVVATAGAALLGPLLFGLAGASLILLSSGLLSFGKAYNSISSSGLFDISDEPILFGLMTRKATNFEIVLRSITSSMAIGPIDAIKILTGSVALAAAGIGMTLLSFGIKEMSKAYADANTKTLFAVSKEPILFGLLKRKVTNFEIMIRNITDSMSLGPITSAGLLLGSGALAAAGIGMTLLSYGIKEMSTAYGKTGTLFEVSDEPILFGLITRKATNFEIMIRSITDSMSLGPLQIINLGSSIPVLIGAGLALSVIANGISGFAKTIEKAGNIKYLSKTISSTITTISQAFGALGGSTVKDKIFNKVFDIPSVRDENGRMLYTPEQVKMGIDSVRGMGDILTGIAEGIAAFATMKYTNSQGKTVSIDPGVQKKAIENIKLTLQTIPQAFGILGSKSKPGALSKVASFLGKKSGINSGLIDSVVGTDEYGPEEIQTGIESVIGIGEVLTGLADGIIAFSKGEYLDAEGKLKKINFDDFKLGGKAVTNIKSILDSMSNIFGSIGAKSKTLSGSALKSVASVFGVDAGFIPGSDEYDAEDVSKGIESLSGISSILSGVSDFIKAFSEKSPEVTLDSMTTFLGGIINTVASLSTKESSNLTGIEYFSKLFTSMVEITEVSDDLKDVEKSVKNIADSINGLKLEKIKEVNTLLSNISGLEENNTAEALEKVADALIALLDKFNGEQSAAAGTPTTTIAQPATQSETGLGTTLSRLQITLNQINATMSNLPADIAAIEIRLPQD